MTNLLKAIALEAGFRIFQRGRKPSLNPTPKQRYERLHYIHFLKRPQTGTEVRNEYRNYGASMGDKP